MKSLDRLVRVGVREAWPIETEFTRWLAQKGNLDALGEELGLPLELIQFEAEVGNFRADILAKDLSNDHNVIIENQFQGTNHDHLGKIITYAAGHDATAVVWIFEDIRDEHRRAIDWLNENTVDALSFYAVELELWKIGSSEPAPRFNVICRPNDWAKSTKQSGGAISTIKQKQFDFWTALRDYNKSTNAGVRLQSPAFQHWTNIAIGTSLAHIALTTNTIEQWVSCALYIRDDHDLFGALEDEKAAIEEELGAPLIWWKSGKAARISQQRAGFDINSEKDYTQVFDWLLDRAKAFKTAFASRIEAYQRNGS